MRNLVFATFLLAAPVGLTQDAERESFRAFAVVMGIHAAGQTNTFQVTIDRWSTNDERQELFVALAETDQDGLIKALQIQEECGFLSMTGTRGPVMRRGSFPSQRIKYARDFRMDGKRRIVLDLDRPIPYWETVNRPRTSDRSCAAARSQVRGSSTPATSAWTANGVSSSTSTGPFPTGRP